jgi:hypothetical protein
MWEVMSADCRYVRIYQEITNVQVMSADNRYVRTRQITDARGHVSRLQIC